MKTQKCVQIDGKPVIVDSHIAAEISRLADQNAELLGALAQCEAELYSIHSQYGDKENARAHSHGLRLAYAAFLKL